MSTRSAFPVLLLLGAAAATPVRAQRLPDVVGQPIPGRMPAPVPQSAPVPAATTVTTSLDTIPGVNGRLSAAQLENLVASVALYPDALLAQVLVAATFPDQVTDAASFVRTNGTDGVDDQPWDLSVKAVAHYPAALNTLADKPEWTAALGRAYASQSGDVMRAVQHLRRMADEQGNLVSNQQQRVVREQDNYLITPAQPQVVYVPAYDPVVIYTRPVFYAAPVSRYWSFGIGFPIGAWLTYDLDWGARTVYYNGWRDPYLGYAGGWRVRSRPFIQITNVYVGPQYRTVFINPAVTRRAIDYRVIDRYPRVHGDTYFAVNGRSDVWRDREGTRDRDWRSEPRTAEPRMAQPRGLESVGTSVEQGRAMPGGYARNRERSEGRSDSYRSEANGVIALPRIERAPRADVPRVEAPRPERSGRASRQEPRGESPRARASGEGRSAHEGRTARGR